MLIKTKITTHNSKLDRDIDNYLYNIQDIDNSTNDMDMIGFKELILNESTIIMNNIIDIGKVPSDWKNYKTILVQKKKNLK